MSNKKFTHLVHKQAPRAIRFLGYGFPRAEGDYEDRISSHEDFTLHDVPLGATASFLDYDGLVMFAGSYDIIDKRHYDVAFIGCKDKADLDLREREFVTLFQHGKPVILLLYSLVERVANREDLSDCDLFRRVCPKLGVKWKSQDRPSTLVESLVPEFRDYASRYGTGYLQLDHGDRDEEIFRPLLISSKTVYGMAVAKSVYLLPCPVPTRSMQVQQIVIAAIEGTLSYRRRVSSQLPAWITQFCFERESILQKNLEDLISQTTDLEAEIGKYGEYKGALCLQSEPLVSVVAKIFDRFFGITLTIDDRCIEDATIRDAEDSVLAILEVKGVKGSFTRNNVNQLDSHRERLTLGPDSLGILIMNTHMDATSIEEKNQAPHPDIIKKAVADHVLLIRTIDLLRLADLTERGLLEKPGIRELILSSDGWLKVDHDRVELVRN